MRKLVLLALLAGAAQAGNEPKHWIFFDSVETANAPRLELTLDDGGTRTVRATEDTLLISYLADRAWGHMPQLSISMGDTNRVLLRFGDLPKKVKKAELVLSMKLSQMAPPEPFELAVYRVEGDWSGRSTNWTTQPKVGGQALAVAAVKPEAQTLRIDVTEAVRAGAPHGWLVKVPGPVRTLADMMGEVVAWETDVSSALAKAKKEKKHVLAFLVGGYGGVKPELGFEETLLTAIVMADPHVKEFVEMRFVPVRMQVGGMSYTHALRGPDPMLPLGTQLAKAKPPALVVATAKGKHVATLESIGTYNAAMVDQFLHYALGKKSTRDPVKFEEAWLKARDGHRYDLACLYYLDGRRKEATENWKKIGKDSPWYVKAQARLREPEMLAMFEAPGDLPLSKKFSSTERPAELADIIGRACAYLVSQQREDGSWLTGNGPDEYQAAMTALSAQALLEHNRGRDAVEKATKWLRDWVAKVDPEKANAWSAGYTLDFFLARLARDKSSKGDAQKAVALVEGGQCDIGAWSYNRKWGMTTTAIQGWPPMPQGRYHSMNTGPSMVSLLQAKEAGLMVGNSTIKKGVQALLDMRESVGIFTYTWPEPRNWNKSVETSLGRASACEQALYMADATKKKELQKTLGFFLKYRAHLRRSVKITAGWTMPGGSSAYFYHFAYLHAAIAARRLNDRKALKELRADLLAVAEADGTWVDWTPYGKHYATAAALRVLAP